MTKGSDPGQVVRAGEATCPWDLNRMTQLISQAGSLGFRPPGVGRGCSFTLPWALLLMAAWSNRKLAGHGAIFTASCYMEASGVVAILGIPTEDGEVNLPDHHGALFLPAVSRK